MRAVVSGLKNNKMKVSVIIPVYNSEKYIEQTIDSVLNQTYKNIEIIVINDGSIDNTEKILESYVNKNQIIYIKKENGGPAAARNLGIKQAQGEYVAFLDSDDIWEPNKIEEQIKLTAKQKEPVVIFSKRFLLPSLKHDDTKLFSGYIYKNLIKNNFITNSSVFIDRKIINDIGQINESPTLFAIEDYEYWLRISKKYCFFYVDLPLVGYRIHEKQINKTTKKHQISKLLLNELIKNLPSRYSFMNFIYYLKMLLFEIRQ